MSEIPKVQDLNRNQRRHLFMYLLPDTIKHHKHFSSVQDLPWWSQFGDVTGNEQ